jgi:hypothetical protein
LWIGAIDIFLLWIGAIDIFTYSRKISIASPTDINSTNPQPTKEKYLSHQSTTEKYQ